MKKKKKSTFQKITMVFVWVMILITLLAALLPLAQTLGF
ncbi:MAG: DUF4044 domain-containing protein [Ligilactobacillus sp.]|nr:DUF4044 domain-containing protein [Ligilactobacillus equi]MCQ2556397.1 DUF4044 domain-containing protein [Ligilactobacillus sp.]